MAYSNDNEKDTGGEKGGLSKRVKSMVILGFRQFWDPYYQGFAAQIAFYLIMSVVPTIIVVSQLLSLVNVNMVNLDYIIDRMADPTIGRLLKRMLSSHLTTGNNILLILMALWASSRARFAMMRIANYLYSNGRTTGDFFTERVRSIKNMSLTVVIFAFIGIILVNGPLILELLFGDLLEGTLINSIWMHFRWPLAGLLYFLIVLHNYWILPNYKLKIKKLTLREVLPGSIFAAAGMLIVTVIYSMYSQLPRSGFNAIYGSLSAVAGLLFWFYLLSWVMILGMLFNKVWMDTKNADNLEVGR